jgi:aldehyde dehydrogenase (NAD+)
MQSMTTITDVKRDWAASWLASTKKLYINGQWVDSRGGEIIESLNPATGAALGRFQDATSADVDLAVAAARGAHESGTWRKLPRRERAKVLRRIAEVIDRHRAELATLECLDNGKLYSEAYNDDLPETAEVFEYYAGWTDKFYSETVPVDDGFINYTVREPVGVCGLIVPWNFPLLLAAWKLAPALAMANTVIVKPSPFTSLSMIRLIEIIDEEVDLPPGVLNLTTGGAETGRLICEHGGINKVSFIGSTATGKKVVRSSADSNLKSVSLELGGKSPNIVFEDVPDLGFAMERSYTAMFCHKGEKCSEPTRLFVHKSLYEQFLTDLVARAGAVRCGDPFDPASTQGAQCNKEQLDKILRYIEIGRQEGGRIVAGGERDITGSNASGYFVRPTIFADVDNKMKIAQDEIFGPVLSVIPFSDEDHVVEMANDSMYGLAAGLWTKDISRAHRVAGRLEAGMVFINRFGCYDFASPFGGFKESGWGKDMAIQSLDAFTRLKSIWVKL